MGFFIGYVFIVQNKVLKTLFFYSYELTSVDRDIAYYMQRLEFEPRTPNFSTFKM